MNNNPVNGSAPTNPVIPASQDGDNQDATAQALFLIGLLGLYATRYAALEAEYNQNHDPNVKAEMDSILSQFNQFRSYFTVNGNSVTFSYDEGSESIVLTDPTLLSLVQGMPTDIDKFNTFWTNPSNAPFISIVQWMSDNNFNFATASQTTQGMALIFMLSTESNLVGSLGGAGAEWLSSTRLFSNSFIAAQALSAFLANDKAINAADLIDALNIPSAGQSYQDFYSILTANYQNWSTNPVASEQDLLSYESLYWPQNFKTSSATGDTVHAAPLSTTHSPIQDKNKNQDDDTTTGAIINKKVKNGYNF